MRNPEDLRFSILKDPKLFVLLPPPPIELPPLRENKRLLAPPPSPSFLLPNSVFSQTEEEEAAAKLEPRAFPVISILLSEASTITGRKKVAARAVRIRRLIVRS